MVITTNTYTYNCILSTFFLSFCIYCCSSKDNITTGESIQDGTDYLESAGKKFRMGFFPGQMGSQQRYLGIWYVMDPKTVVWVANRERPVHDSSGVLTITESGDINLLDQHQTVYFSTNKGQAGSISSG